MQYQTEKPIQTTDFYVTMIWESVNLVHKGRDLAEKRGYDVEFFITRDKAGRQEIRFMVKP